MSLYPFICFLFWLTPPLWHSVGLITPPDIVLLISRNVTPLQKNRERERYLGWSRAGGVTTLDAPHISTVLNETRAPSPRWDLFLFDFKKAGTKPFAQSLFSLGWRIENVVAEDEEARVPLLSQTRDCEIILKLQNYNKKLNANISRCNAILERWCISQEQQQQQQHTQCL